MFLSGKELFMYYLNKVANLALAITMIIVTVSFFMFMTVAFC